MQTVHHVPNLSGTPDELSDHGGIQGAAGHIPASNHRASPVSVPCAHCPRVLHFWPLSWLCQLDFLLFTSWGLCFSPMLWAVLWDDTLSLNTRSSAPPWHLKLSALSPGSPHHTRTAEPWRVLHPTRPTHTDHLGCIPGYCSLSLWRLQLSTMF